MLNLGTRNNFNNQNIMSTVYGNLAANGTSSMNQRKSRNSGGGSLVQPALSQYQMMGGDNALTLVQLQSDNQTIDRAPNQLSAGLSPYFQGGKKLPTGQTFYNNNDFMQSSQNQYMKVGNIKSHLEGTKIKKSAITARKSYGGGAIGQLLAARDSQSREVIKNQQSITGQKTKSKGSIQTMLGQINPSSGINSSGAINNNAYFQ